MSSYRSTQDAIISARERGVTYDQIYNLLTLYGAVNAAGIQARHLEAFTRDCKALGPPPPPLLSPKFAIGDKVRLVCRNVLGTLSVTGYEFRYVLAHADGKAIEGSFGYREDKLVAAPIAPQLAFQVGDAVETRDGEALGRVTGIKYSVSGSIHDWSAVNLRHVAMF